MSKPITYLGIALSLLAAACLDPEAPEVETTEAELVLPCGGLGSNQRLNRGDRVDSCNGRAKFLHQTDGNVVLYDEVGWIWQTGTAGRATTHLSMQGDGNLVLYNGTSVVWSSQTFNHPGATLSIQSDCNAVIYQGSARWWTGTQCRTADLSTYPIYGFNFYGEGAENTVKNGKGMWSLEMIYANEYQRDAQRARLANIKNRGFRIILRLDYGRGATIPLEHRPESWTQRAQFAATAGQIAADLGDLVDVYVIGNEPQDPSGGSPSAWWYAVNFNGYDGNCVYDKIKQARPGAVVSIFAPGGWPSQEGIDYFNAVLNTVDRDGNNEPQIDAFALHAYSGAETTGKLVAEDPRFSSGLDFGAFKIFAEIIHGRFAGARPIYITETNTYWFYCAWGGCSTHSQDSYRDNWMKEAYQAIAEWNAANDQKVHGLLWYVYQHCGPGCADQYEQSLARTDNARLNRARDDLSWVTANTNMVPGKPGGALRFQAENFNNSDTRDGRGLATGLAGTDYHDTSGGNSGGHYRTEPGDDVDIVALPNYAGFSVGFTRAGEWLKYRTLTSGGNYKLRARYARGPAGAVRLRLYVDGVWRATLSLDGTGGWGTYREVLGGEVFNLPKGAHELRVYFEGDDADLDWFQLDRV